MKQILLIILLGTGISITAQTLSLSFDDALRQMQQGNRSLKIADKGIEAARAERDKLNALWYPSLQGAGTFVHLSEKNRSKQPLSQFTDPAKDFVHNLVPDDQFISGILDQIGSHTLVFPLAPRNLTTVGLTAEWIVFSGGKRIRAGKIGNTMIDMARREPGTNQMPHSVSFWQRAISACAWHKKWYVCAKTPTTVCNNITKMP